MGEIGTTVLADERPTWRPGRFGYIWGCSLDFRFPAAKLLDLTDAELDESANVFATIALAHRAAQRTAGNDEPRRAQKLWLVRRLYERGLGPEDVRELFRLIDWFLALPREMDQEVWREIERIEQEKDMPFISSVERIGMEKGIEKGFEKGIEKGVEKGLEQAIELTLAAKFGEEGRALMADVRQGASVELFQSLLRRIPTAASLDEVRATLRSRS